MHICPSIFVLYGPICPRWRGDSNRHLPKGGRVGPGMYGVFFEEINHAGDGGLYAELVNNRSFEELEMPEGYRAENGRLYPKPVVHHATGKVADKHGAWTRDPFPAWSLSAPDGAASMRLTKDRPKFKTAPTNLEVDISNAAVPVRLVNSGYWGMNIVAGEKYILRTIIRVSGGYSGKITAKLQKGLCCQNCLFRRTRI